MNRRFRSLFVLAVLTTLWSLAVACSDEEDTGNPSGDTSGATSGTDTSGVTSGSDTSGVTSGSDTSGATSGEVDTSGATTSSGTDTSGADTSGTTENDTSGADTSGADTSGADTADPDTTDPDTTDPDTTDPDTTDPDTTEDTTDPDTTDPDTTEDPDTTGDTSGAVTPTYTNDVQPIYQAKCASCHTVGGSGGKNFATNYADTQLDSYHCPGEKVGFCTLVRIQEGSMPAGRGCTGDPTQDAANTSCLTADQQQTIQDWIDAGMPE